MLYETDTITQLRAQGNFCHAGFGGECRTRDRDTRHTACNGIEALEKLAERSYALMLIDLMMPNMDGWQLIDTLQKDPVLAHIPSAVVSAARDRRRLPDEIVTFSKPCNLQEVIRFLHTACPDPVNQLPS